MKAEKLTRIVVLTVSLWAYQNVKAQDNPYLKTDLVFEINKKYSFNRNPVQEIEFTSNGNLNLLDNNRIFWSSNTPEAVKCVFTVKEGLLLYNSKDSVVWGKVPKLTKSDEMYQLANTIEIILIKSTIVTNPPGIREDDILLLTHNYPTIFLDNNQPCGCKDKGQVVYIVNTSGLNLYGTVAHSYPTFGDKKYENYSIPPNSRIRIGCSLHECTKLNPLGYPEVFELQGASPF